VEFFVLCCGINQATQLHDIFRIIVITNSIHAAKKIFNLLSHPLQKQSASILRDLRSFFMHHPKNTIEFWECPSKSNWCLYKAVDSDTSPSILSLCYQTGIYGTSAKKQRVMTSSTNGKCHFKLQISRVEVFSTLLTVMTIFLNHLTAKVVHGFNILATPTHSVPELQEL